MPCEGYKMTELGELPEEWEIAKLSDERVVQKMKAGGTPLSGNENYYKNGSISFVKIEDMTRSGKYLYKTEVKITDEGLKNCSAWLIPKDSVIYSMYASFGEATINKIPVATNQAIIAIIPQSADDVEYLYYALWNIKSSLHKYLRETTQKNLNAEVVKNLHISLPPSTERHRIAELLSTMDETIEYTEAIIEKYRDIKKGLMADLLKRGIDEEGRIRSEETHRFKDSPFGRIPEGWELRTCDSLCNEINVGIVIKPSQYYEEDGVPVLRSANICEWGLNPSDLMHMSEQSNQLLVNSMVRTGDVLTVRTGYPGTSCVVPPKFDCANCVDIIISRPSKEIESAFLSLWINSDFGRGQVLRAQGGLAQQHFNVSELKKLLVAKPPIHEQRTIQTIIESINNRIRTEESYHNKLKLLKMGLMQDLLTGRVRVTVPQEVQA